ncbi:TetR/AcrR family transcriptional regulator [Nocardia salmonicida]|uniref:TetR/AcrR family transcriptional regulator n=1 Tax=Nocardia salmonicida TaxID=53431 RepID=UPI0033F31F50
MIAKLVEAGIASLVTRPEQLLDRGLTAEDVSIAAGVSNATFYRRFTDKRAYISTLVGEIVGAPSYSEHELRARVREATTSAEDLSTAVLRKLLTQVFPDVTEAQTVARRVLAHLFADSNPIVAQSVRDDYHRRDSLVLAVYDEAFARGGLSLRRPFTPKAFAVVIDALFEGFQLRYRRDPSAVSPRLIADAMQALLGGVLDEGEHEHLDDLPTLRSSPPQPVALPRNSRASVLATARSEFRKRGYFMTRMDTIAAGSGVPIQQLRKLFPTKPHLIIGALRPQVDAIGEAIADDRLLELDETTIVENYLLRCARMAARDMPFTDALMVALAHDTYGEPDRVTPLKEELNLPALVAPTIERGQRRGVFSTVEEPMEVATELTNSILLRCFTRRLRSPEDNARIVATIALHGLIER